MCVRFNEGMQVVVCEVLKVEMDTDKVKMLKRGRTRGSGRSNANTNCVLGFAGANGKRRLTVITRMYAEGVDESAEGGKSDDTGGEDGKSGR